MSDPTTTAATVGAATGAALLGLSSDALIGGLMGAFAVQAFFPPQTDHAAIIKAAIFMGASVLLAGVFAPFGIAFLPASLALLPDAQKLIGVGAVIGIAGPSIVTLIQSRIGAKP
jgi:hypothetical protein